ncbi:MAG: hypothetical protein WEA35_02110 [Candidatus Nanopelagicales bacterium]
MATIDAFDPPEVRRREQRGWYFYDGAASAFSGRIASPGDAYGTENGPARRIEECRERWLR